MKKKLLASFVLLSVYSVSGQEVISTQGDTYSTANGSIDYTIGEVVIETGTDGINDVTQGLHQTNWSVAGIEDHAPNYEARIFPNPTSDRLHISTSSYEGVSYTLFDSQGKIVKQNPLTGSTTQIQVSSLATGSYSVLLKDSNNQFLKTFKLIKNQ